jgi:hypothetical protein
MVELRAAQLRTCEAVHGNAVARLSAALRRGGVAWPSFAWMGKAKAAEMAAFVLLQIA